MAHEILRNQLRGELLEPGHASYDATRVIWNGMIDRRPALIARCRNAADVVACVNYARSNDIIITVRSGGHNVAGYAVSDDGLMIDLSQMNSVRVSSDLDRTYAQGGATWADVDAATTPFDRATPGGLISATGVAGLTLSGGIGWLRGTRGLSCDNLKAADVVTAEGRLIHTSSTENSDLLWAIKGGGGNFGIVVDFEFQLHPIAPEMMFCAPAYREEQANDILPKWRDFMASAPDEVTGLAEFSTIPNDPSYPQETWGKRVLALATVYDGPADHGERIMQPLREFDEPLLDFSGRMPYRALQTLYDGLFPKGRDRCYWKSTYLKNLDSKTIQMITEILTKRPSEMTFASIWKFGGVVQRIAAETTAFGDRSMPFMLSIDAIWNSAADDNSNLQWVRTFWTGMQPLSTGRMYLNFPGLGEGDKLVSNAFGPEAYSRLQKIKNKYDPKNLFRMNQNIVPKHS